MQKSKTIDYLSLFYTYMALKEEAFNEVEKPLNPF